MEFQKILTFAGPNIWAAFPVLEAWIELGDLKDSPSNEIPGFNDRLTTWLPTMIEHRCSIGERGGFFERLRRGTYLAHILEHVTLELQARAGADLGFGRARETSKEGLFRVAIHYEDEPLARACLETGRRLCLAAVYDHAFDVNEEIRKLRALADDVILGPSTRAMVDAARARGIPVIRLNSESLLPLGPPTDRKVPTSRLESDSLVQLGHGARRQRIWTAETDRTSAIAQDIAKDKEVTRALLRQLGVPMPAGRSVKSPQEAWQAAQAIGLPVVVKPQYGNQGDGVVIGISTREQVEAAFRFATPFGGDVLVEELAHGAEHRLLVVGGKLAAAVRGNPAVVVGDGRQTVRALIDSQLNSDPRRGPDLSYPLSPIEPNARVQLVLEQEGYTLDSVPEAGKQVTIQRNGNLGIDVTDQVHPEVARVVEFAARAVGLDIAGIDVLAEDIGRPLAEQGGVIIEVNAGPGLQMHLFPESGKPRPVGEAIVATLFPPGQDGRIPVVSVSGLSNTTEVTMLIAQLLASGGRTVGMTNAEGTFIDNWRTRAGDSCGNEAARSVLINPLVEAAVFEVSQQALLEEGVGFDQCTVAVLTEMGPGPRLDFEEWDTDHKKSLVYRAVSDVVLPRGAVVLKTGEPLAELIIKHCPGKAILFSDRADDPEIDSHRRSEGRAAFARGSHIVLAAGTKESVLAAPANVSLAVALPAAAAAWAVGMTAEEIAAAWQPT